MSVFDKKASISAREKAVQFRLQLPCLAVPLVREIPESHASRQFHHQLRRQARVPFRVKADAGPAATPRWSIKTIDRISLEDRREHGERACQKVVQAFRRSIGRGAFGQVPALARLICERSTLSGRVRACRKNLNYRPP